MHRTSLLAAVLTGVLLTPAFAQPPAHRGSASATLTVSVTILPSRESVARAATMVLDADGVQRKLTEEERVRLVKQPEALRELVRSPTGTAVLRIDY